MMLIVYCVTVAFNITIVFVFFTLHITNGMFLQDHKHQNNHLNEFLSKELESSNRREAVQYWLQKQSYLYVYYSKRLSKEKEDISDICKSYETQEVNAASTCWCFPFVIHQKNAITYVSSSFSLLSICSTHWTCCMCLNQLIQKLKIIQSSVIMIKAWLNIRSQNTEDKLLILETDHSFICLVALQLEIMDACMIIDLFMPICCRRLIY